MAKFLNRLAARLGREQLRESAKEGKNWIVTKRLVLEAEDAEGNAFDAEFDKGSEVEIGATPEGDMALNGSAAVVVISDPELASKIADVVVSSDELSDVNFVEKPALDAVMDGENVEDVIDNLADDEDDNVEVAELDVDQKESVESKFNKFSMNRLNPTKYLTCESILIDESDEAPINMSTIKIDRVKRESFEDYSKFASRISELNGSIQPGAREIALGESGKVIGAFDKASSHGDLFTENEFDSAEDMDNFNAEPEALVKDVDLGDEGSIDAVESCLKQYEESAKSGKDYMALVEGLTNAKLTESVIGNIVATFDNRQLKECVRTFDSKYGKYVACFKESVDCDNFIAETGEEKRFTKRYFA